MPELTELQKKRLMETLGTSAVNPWSDGANVNSNVPALEPGFYDDAVRNLKDGTQLGARTTKTPINIIRFLPESGYPERTAGMYNKSGWRKDSADPKMTIALRSDANGTDMQQVIRHENVHAALDIAKRKGLPIPGINPATANVVDALKSFFGINPPNVGTYDNMSNVYESWNKSNRAGQRDAEIPAYMMAYRKGQLPDVSPENAAAYRDRYLASASPELRALLQHILGIK